MQRKIASAAVLTVSAVALTGCSQFSAQTGDDTKAVNVSSQEAITATTNVDTKKILPAGARIKIDAQEPWTVERVTTNGPSGYTQDAGLNAPVWKSQPLTPGQMTTVTAYMRNPNNGQTQTVARSVLAGPATDTFTAELSPSGGTYGVGIIPTVTFSKDIPEASRADLTKRLKVSTRPKTVVGSWRWITPSSVAFRPASFWPGKTKVIVSADIKNVQIGKGQKAAWGEKNEDVKFKTGKNMIVHINGAAVNGYVSINGKDVHDFPVSLGKSGYTTRSGIKTLTEKYRVKRMTNNGVTTEEVYDLQVPYAMRMTDSGEFLHAAPWNGNIGYANTSHGCSNLTMSDAIWIYDRMIPGIPVITKGTGRQMESWNGPGGLWNIKAKKWARTVIPVSDSQY